jgi:hypothetical protein
VREGRLGHICRLDINEGPSSIEKITKMIRLQFVRFLNSKFKISHLIVFGNMNFVDVVNDINDVNLR